MIDFNNASYAKLQMVPNDAFGALVTPLLVEGEQIVSTYKGMRDGVVFTNKRIIAINVKGISGKKKDFSSLPYKKITAFSVETAGTLDLDSELDLWFSGMGQVRFEFTRNSDITRICNMISSFAL